MSIEEYVKQSRAEHKQKFGNIGLKKDCEHYGMKGGYNSCKACSYVRDRGTLLPCECGVCYFYSPKD